MPFGSWSIEQACFDKIREILPAGKTILELGSGWTTGELAKHYQMISVEHEARFCGRHPSRYIHAPMKLGWYDPSALAAGLEGLDYDLLLVDGPPAIVIGNAYSRLALLAHWDLFLHNVPIVLDDTERRPERTLAEHLGLLTGRAPKFFREPNQKGFCVL